MCTTLVHGLSGYDNGCMGALTGSVSHSEIAFHIVKCRSLFYLSTPLFADPLGRGGGPMPKPKFLIFL